MGGFGGGGGAGLGTPAAGPNLSSMGGGQGLRVRAF
jgi:hypothetical protein